MAIEIFIVAALAAVAAYALVAQAPRAAFSIVWGRRLLAGTFGVLGAIFLISTSMTELMLLGGLILFFVFLTILVDRPDEEVSW